MSVPPLPNFHAVAVLVLTVIALVLFSREKISLESSSLTILMALAVGFEIIPFHDATSGVALHATDFFFLAMRPLSLSVP